MAQAAQGQELAPIEALLTPGKGPSPRAPTPTASPPTPLPASLL